MTLSMTRSVLETGRAIGGQSIREHNEIIGMDAALHFLNGTMLAPDNPLEIQTILDIHRRLLGWYSSLQLLVLIASLSVAVF